MVAPFWALRKQRRKTMNQVVISVRGGVAEIAYASKGVEVAIVDFDDAEAEGKSGESKLRYWIARAKQDEKMLDNVKSSGSEAVRSDDFLDLLSRAAYELADMRGRDDPRSPIESYIAQVLAKANDQARLRSETT
jgi:hypothetical protein